MLSQLNLRFHKKLIEALKTRAGRENTSVNALAERFLDDGLKTVAPGDGYFQLIADPEATVRQLYRHIILGQTFGTSALSRDELRFVLVHVREAFLRGHNRLATLPALDTLLDITGNLLAWQVEHDRPVDGHYLKGIFRLAGKNWTEEFEAFRAALRPVVDQMYAEHLLRPLESDCFGLAEVPDAVLAEIFTLPRLKAVFPLMLRGLDWNTEQARTLAQELRPVISAVTETIEAGTLRLEIRVDGQHPGERPGGLVHHTPSAPADHRPGLRGAVRLGSVIRTAGPVHAVCPASGSPDARSPGGASDVLPARKRHAGGLLRDRRPADFYAGGGL